MHLVVKDLLGIKTRNHQTIIKVLRGVVIVEVLPGEVFKKSSKKEKMIADSMFILKMYFNPLQYCNINKNASNISY